MMVESLASVSVNSLDRCRNRCDRLARLAAAAAELHGGSSAEVVQMGENARLGNAPLRCTCRRLLLGA
jgi:hypothetical protein